MKIDDCDKALLEQYNWNTDHGYIRSSLWRDGGSQTIYLHRMIMNAREGEYVDHINGDKQDNRRSNLRLCTNGENQFNSPKQKGPYSSKYKGVSRERNRWSAYIQVDGKKRRLGKYDTEEEAAKAYNKAARELVGEFAMLNEVV